MFIGTIEKRMNDNGKRYVKYMIESPSDVATNISYLELRENQTIGCIGMIVRRIKRRDFESKSRENQAQIASSSFQTEFMGKTVPNQCLV